MINEINDKIFDFIYREAFGDATRRTTCASQSESFLKNEEAKTIVHNYIDSILNNRKIKAVDVAQDVVRTIGGSFTFGNAQKLVNMTAKYFYLLVYRDQGLRFCFDQCDCPMDLSMKQTVIKAYKRFLDQNNQKHRGNTLLTIKKDGKDTINWDWVAWSKLTTKEDIEIYNNFQSIVRFLAGREKISPIEYDYIKGLFKDV